MNVNYRNNYLLAQNQFIDYSTSDSTAILAKEHGLIGLTRLITCMEILGLDCEQVNLIALPDFTYTRNKLRWSAGFPYGCVIKFGENIPPFIPLDFRPNCCGVVLAELEEFDENPESLQKKYIEIISSYSNIDKSDLNRRNHFMGSYFCEKNNKFYFLIHGSFNFVKEALYYERNETLLSLSKSETIMGEPFTYLIDSNAKHFYESYLEHERLTMYYRNLIIKEMLPQAKIVFNRTHEGFYDMQTLLLGAYAENHPFSCPIMLAPEVDLPFVNVTNPINLQNETKLYLSPHGGGYALYGVCNTQRVDSNLQSDYILTYPNQTKLLTDNVLDMPFCYRTNTSHCWCDRFNMAIEHCKMTPIFNLKI